MAVSAANFVANTPAKVDYLLVFGLLILSVFSLFVLYSAGGENLTMLWRQTARIIIGLIIMLLIARVSPENIARFSPTIYTIGLVLLILVLVFGIIGKGAQRWLNLGFIRFQPAEIMKLGVPMMVAWLLSRNPLPPRISDLFIAAVVIFFPTVLVILQPDLGTAILIAVSGVMVVFFAGMRWRHILFLVGIVVAAAPMMWWQLHDYQRQRIITLFDPWSDPLGSGYHTIQSIIAIGAGGTSGKGWLAGSQSQLDFIPERTTDFIFAVLAEEFGLIGVFILLTVYLFIIGRCLWITSKSESIYARLLGGSLTLTFFFYLFVNIGMVSGILPVVGVPLPLISYGGTSIVTLMAGFGIVMSIYTKHNAMSGQRSLTR